MSVLFNIGSRIAAVFKTLASSLGAGLIGWIQAGVGAVLRTIQDKLRERVSVKDFGALGDGVTDDTAAIRAAIAYIQTQGGYVESTGHWPATQQQTLFFPPGTYMVSSPIADPSGLRPNFINFNIKGDGAIIKATAGYAATNSFIHLKAAFNYTIEGLAFDGFKNYHVIFNDSSLTQNYGGKAEYKNLKFANTDYGIRHELESVVAIFDQCTTDKSIKQFLRVWRADQVIIRDGAFNWEQQGLTQDDSFISFGVDDYTPTGEAAFPGNATYNVGRLNITNTMFIPVGIGATPVHTSWVGLYGGFVVIKGCHFGPESTNRPSVVMNFAKPALYTDTTSLVDSGIIIKDSSCVSSYDLIYCKTNYPNVVKLDNIRWNTLYYENTGAHITHLLGGVAGVLNSLALEPYKEHFSFSFNNIYPAYRAKRPYDSRLIFPSYIAEIGPYVRQAESYSGGSNLFFDLANRDGTHPSSMYQGIYEVTLKSCISYNSGTYDVDITMKNILQIKVENNILSIINTQAVAPSFSQPPSLTASFLVNGVGASTVNLATYSNEVDTIAVRLLYATNVGTNAWYKDKSTVKIKNIF